MTFYNYITSMKIQNSRSKPDFNLINNLCAFDLLTVSIYKGAKNTKTEIMGKRFNSGSFLVIPSVPFVL